MSLEHQLCFLQNHSLFYLPYVGHGIFHRVAMVFLLKTWVRLEVLLIVLFTGDPSK